MIRWGHAAVWVFMAAMFLTLVAGSAGTFLVGPLGLLALATYLAFLAILFSSARR